MKKIIAILILAFIGCGEPEKYAPDANADTEILESGTPMCQAPDFYVPTLVSGCINWPLQALCYWVNPGVTWRQVVGCKVAYCTGSFCRYVTCVSACTS